VDDLGQVKVSVQGVSKSYQSKEGMTVEALRDLSFDVSEQEFVCVVGPNGCGKTTLLRIIAGLEEATSGRVLIDGEETKVGKVGMIFQEFSLFPWRTVIDNVKFGLEIIQKDEDERLKIAQRFVDLVGLSKFESAYPHELSEGMKQKVAIARALATNPSVLLLDEPFAFLDAQTRNLMQEEFLRIWEREKKTVIFVTHNADEATYLADRVVILTARPGRVEAVEKIELGRPRSRTSQSFVKKREGILKHLQKEVRPV
jgi:NitT/TauT family transport system ATP-binding protein